MNSRYIFIGSFVVVVGVISYGDMKNCQELPFPPRFIAAAVVFGMLDLLSGILGNAAYLIGIGIVAAMLICTACPEGSCKGCNMQLLRPNCNARLALSTEQPPSYQVLAGANSSSGTSYAQ